MGATLFPHNIGLGATRNPELVRAIAKATAREMSVIGQDWNFAPTLAVARNARWGRTYEAYAEEPELLYTYGKAVTEGLRSEEHTSELQSRGHLVCRLLLENK